MNQENIRLMILASMKMAPHTNTQTFKLFGKHGKQQLAGLISEDGMKAVLAELLRRSNPDYYDTMKIKPNSPPPEKTHKGHRVVIISGEHHTFASAGRKYGVNPGTIKNRFKKGLRDIDLVAPVDIYAQVNGKQVSVRRIACLAEVTERTVRRWMAEGVDIAEMMGEEASEQA